jgi:hypothetical protein
MQLISILADFVSAADPETAADAVVGISKFSDAVTPDNKAFLALSDKAGIGADTLLQTPLLIRSGPLAIVITGFFLHVAMEMWSFKPKLDFKPHMIRLVVYSLLIMGFAPFATTISSFVMSIGAISAANKPDGETVQSFLINQKDKFDAAQDRFKEVTAEADAISARKAADARKQQQDAEKNLPFTERFSKEAERLKADREAREASETTIIDDIGGEIASAITGLIFTAMALVTHGSFLFASLAIFFLKMLQSTMMKVIIGMGPLMIAFGSWPGVTSRYLSSWLSALIETSAWGLVAATFIKLMVGNVKDADVETVNFFEYIGLNILYAASLLSVPMITSSILRGSAATGVTASAMLAASTGAATSLARGVAGAGGAAQKAFSSKSSDKKQSPGGGGEGGGGQAPPAPRSADTAADTAYSPPPSAPASSSSSADRDFHRNKGANAKAAAARAADTSDKP